MTSGKEQTCPFVHITFRFCSAYWTEQPQAPLNGAKKCLFSWASICLANSNTRKTGILDTVVMESLPLSTCLGFGSAAEAQNVFLDWPILPGPRGDGLPTGPLDLHVMGNMS